jgi:hypothetical protein
MHICFHISLAGLLRVINVTHRLPPQFKPIIKMVKLPVYIANPIQSKLIKRSFAAFLRCNILKVGG